MDLNITSAEHLDGHRLKLDFWDGRSGVVDHSDLRCEGMVEPLGEVDYFRRVNVDAETATIVWPNGVDLDPLVLHSQAMGTPLDDLGARPVA